MLLFRHRNNLTPPFIFEKKKKQKKTKTNNKKQKQTTNNKNKQQKTKHVTNSFSFGMKVDLGIEGDHHHALTVAQNVKDPPKTLLSS